MKVLGMNKRNRLISRANSPSAQRLCKDKESLKERLIAAHISTPATLFVIKTISEASCLSDCPQSFVIKPDRGFGGRGILVLDRDGGNFISPGGSTYNLHDVKYHIQRILEGQFSGLSENDFAMIETRINACPKLMFRYAVGLADIRVICIDFEPVAAMMRYPTAESDGKANLAAGALGIGLSLLDGSITRIYSEKHRGFYQKSDLNIPEGFRVPSWPRIVDIARRAAQVSGLGFAGVDVVLNQEDTPLILEVNGYPGLEIQNVLGVSLSDVIKS